MGKLCGLFGKTRAAMYDQQKRLQSEVMVQDIVLHYVQQIRATLPRLGTRKLHYKLEPLLKDHDIKVGRDYLFDLLEAHKMLIRQRRRKVVTTNPLAWMRKFPNLIKDLVVTRPEHVWVSDITYIRLINQWGYLSLVTDVYSRRIMGYAFRTDLKAQGCADALQMALDARAYRHLELIHHSDKGSQYGSDLYLKLLRDHEIAISVTQKRDPYENALAERVNGILKNEFNLYECNMGFKAAVQRVADCIKIYNEQRPHSSCNYLTPQQAHRCQGGLQKKWKDYPRKKAVHQMAPSVTFKTK